MLKKYFIRKTQADLLQEQIKLMERMLERRNTATPLAFNPSAAFSAPEQQEQMEFDFSVDDEATYIPKQQSEGTTTNLTVKTSTAKIDEDNIKKLKKIRADATKLV